MSSVSESYAVFGTLALLPILGGLGGYCFYNGRTLLSAVILSASFVLIALLGWVIRP